MKTEEQWAKERDVYGNNANEALDNGTTIKGVDVSVKIDILFELKKIAESLQNLRRLP